MNQIQDLYMMSGVTSHRNKAMPNDFDDETSPALTFEYV